MEKVLPIARELSRSKWLAPLVIFLTLAVLAITIWFGATQLRPGLREQLINHDGEVLLAVAHAEQLDAAPAADLARQMETSAGQFALVLRLSKLKDGVLAARLFDARGKGVAAAPASVRETDLPSADLAALSRLQPVSRFEPAARLDDFFLLNKTSSSARASVPLHLVLIPLHAPDQTNLLAAAQLILEGQSLAREFAALDRHLWRQGLAAFALSGGVLTMALLAAFRWLGQLNRRLQDQAASLRRANQELALAAKTSALGTVTAHLMHGLASPLTGLQQFVAARGDGDAESQDALRHTERMQALLGDTVRLLSEEQGDTRYELPVAELVDVLAAKVQPLAQAAGVRFDTKLAATAVLSNRDANLIALILENVLRNAIEATPRGRDVRLEVLPAEGGMLWRVEDQGPGMPESTRETLFQPCRSTKAGGHGIGLAISQQLARHLGAELDLVRNAADGCVFALRLATTATEGEDAESQSAAVAGPNNHQARLPQPTAPCET